MTAHWSGEGRRAITATATILLTPEETAHELRIARRRVFDLIREGTLPSVKIGKSRRISRQAIERYVASLEDGSEVAS